MDSPDTYQPFHPYFIDDTVDELKGWLKDDSWGLETAAIKAILKFIELEEFKDAESLYRPLLAQKVGLHFPNLTKQEAHKRATETRKNDLDDRNSQVIARAEELRKINSELSVNAISQQIHASWDEHVDGHELITAERIRKILKKNDF